MTEETPQHYQGRTMTPKRFWMILLCLTAAVCAAPSALASGSRDLYPQSDEGKFQAARANLEWRTDTYGNLLLRRTLLHVYAVAGEYILVGSSAVGVGSGDALIYNPGSVTGAVGSESVPATPDFRATSQSGKGEITSRTQELAGPQSADGTGNTSGYAPAFYVAPQTGIYSVVFYGPLGGNASSNGAVSGDIPLTSSGDFSTGQGTSVAAWDVTVRDSASSTTDITGRVFAYYLALFTGSNGRSLYGDLYAATTDGYQYEVALNGVDPNGFIIYGNQVGFYDSDGASPLYHDVVSNVTNSGQVYPIEGGCSLALPSYPLFFHLPATETLTAAGVATAPTDPILSALSFSGTAGGNNSRLGTGGTFRFTSNLPAVYDIIISCDNVNIDPTLPANRRLRGVRPSGASAVTWDGKDNSGANFPVGTGYGFKATIHAGEYHFPLLDAENSTQGGPNVTLLNHANANGSSYTVGFYDDRGYVTLNGTDVTNSATPGAAGVGVKLGGIDPPSVINADPINGFDMASNQRAYGQTGNNGNANATDQGSFGDTKGLDLWTYFPSPAQSSTLNIQGAPTLLLVKRITAVNGVNETGFDDDPNTTDDNSPYWPSPAAAYLRGVRSVTNVKPGDELEYTIYFVDTNGPAANITLADALPANTAFEAAAYGAASGIALASSASALPTSPTAFLTNAADSDQGAYDPAAAKVTVTLPSLPAATGAGAPTNSYGFIRFRVHVQ